MERTPARIHVSLEAREHRVIVQLSDERDEVAYVYDLVQAGRLLLENADTLPLPFRGQFLLKLPDRTRPLTIRVGRFEATATESIERAAAVRLVVSCPPNDDHALASLESALRDVPPASSDHADDGDAAGRVDEFAKVQRMTFAQRMIYATRAGQSGRAVLMQQPSPLLMLYLCKNPLIGLPEIIHIAKLPSIDALVAEYIVKMLRANPEWAMSDELKVALVGNSKTPVGTALALIKHLSSRSLRQLTKRGELRASVRQAAIKTLIDRRD